MTRTAHREDGRRVRPRERNKRLRQIIRSLARTPDDNQLTLARRLATTETLLADLEHVALMGGRLDAAEMKNYTNLLNAAASLYRLLGIAAPEMPSPPPRDDVADTLRHLTDGELRTLQRMLDRSHRRADGRPPAEQEEQARRQKLLQHLPRPTLDEG